MKKKNSNASCLKHIKKTKIGFTLIELLAVLVILSIISVIAVPIVLNLIEKTEKEAARIGTLNYVNGVRTYMMLYEMENGKQLPDGNYNVSEPTTIDGKEYLPLNQLVKMSSEQPSGGFITITDGKITYMNLTMNDYQTEYANGEAFSYDKGSVASLESISFEESEVSVLKGESLTLHLVYTPENGVGKSTTFTSSNENIATIDNIGTITALNEGTITITAKTVSGKEASITVVVYSYTGLEVKEYTSGEEITYGNIPFEVISDNGDTVTIITKSNIATGAYGNSTDFNSSTAKTVLESWLEENQEIKNEKDGGALILDSLSNIYVRLPQKSELNGSLANASSTAFWTMTANGNELYYGLPNGTNEYTKYNTSYSSYSTSTVSASASPQSTSVVVSQSLNSSTGYDQSCHSWCCGSICHCAHVEGCNDCECTQTCEECTPYSYTTYSSSNNTASIGYRAVITVRKK